MVYLFKKRWIFYGKLLNNQMITIDTYYDVLRKQKNGSLVSTKSEMDTTIGPESKLSPKHLTSIDIDLTNPH